MNNKVRVQVSVTTRATRAVNSTKIFEWDGNNMDTLIARIDLEVPPNQERRFLCKYDLYRDQNVGEGGGQKYRIVSTVVSTPYHFCMICFYP